MSQLIMIELMGAFSSMSNHFDKCTMYIGTHKLSLQVNKSIMGNYNHQYERASRVIGKNAMWEESDPNKRCSMVPFAWQRKYGLKQQQ